MKLCQLFPVILKAVHSGFSQADTRKKRGPGRNPFLISGYFLKLAGNSNGYDICLVWRKKKAPEKSGAFCRLLYGTNKIMPYAY